MKRLLIAACFLSTTAFAAEPVRLIIPVAGSAAGSFNSHFKTELQLNNRSMQPMAGTIVYHPQGQSASAGDPTYHYSLAPHETLAFDDFVGNLGLSGLGSVDFVPDAKGLPTVVARAFDDKGDEGTTGATIPSLRSDEALQTGETATLIAPADRGKFRFNVGVRSLSAGATLRVTIYGPEGIARKTLDIPYAPEFFTQATADQFTGDTVLSGESLSIEVLNGSVMIYGTTTDNATNDPSIQVAVRNQ